MSDQTAVERVGDLMIQLQRCRTGRETPQENLDDLEQISTLFVGIAQELDAANATIENLRLELTDLTDLFDLQRTRMTEAIALWRVGNPGNDHTLPDLGELLKWLIDRKGESYDRVLEIVDVCFHHFGSSYRSEAKLMAKEMLNRNDNDETQ